uniref:DUF659 domain-containing protein n=1 Tax=Fagus sylvatica TaxID=28930 RepID=A0A2N9H841_FAGSY
MGQRKYKDKYYISELLMNVIKEIRPEKVVQVITDNAYVMKAAGSLIEAEYPHIFWTPCIVHTLNLALKNICAPKNTERNAVTYVECNWIAQIADDAFFICVFIMNHSMRLTMFNEISPLKLLAVADTRFETILVILKRMKLIKRSLQSMVISEQWTSYKEDDVGKATRVRDIILDDLWWDRVDYIILFTSPIYDMLRAADTNKPTLHLVYDMLDTMIEKVKAIIFQHEGKQEGEISTFYNVVYDILIDRWTKNCTPFHCMAHSLNPKYYSTKWLELSLNLVPSHQDLKISEERNKCLERFFLDDHERTLAKTEFGKFSRGIINGDSWEDPYEGGGMLEIASLILDEPELEKEVMGSISETVGSSVPADSESVGDEDDEEDVVLG